MTRSKKEEKIEWAYFLKVPYTLMVVFILGLIIIPIQTIVILLLGLFVGIDSLTTMNNKVSKERLKKHYNYNFDSKIKKIAENWVFWEK